MCESSGPLPFCHRGLRPGVQRTEVLKGSSTHSCPAHKRGSLWSIPRENCMPERHSNTSCSWLEALHDNNWSAISACRHP